MTAGLVDNTDLFIEEIGPDGCSVREGDGYVPCERIVELIEVRGGEPVEEVVLITRARPDHRPGAGRRVWRALDPGHLARSAAGARPVRHPSRALG